MDIDRVTLTATDPDAAGRWYADTLDLPVTRGASSVEVTVGRSVLALRPGLTPTPGRSHHLAFSVAPDRFDDARARLAARTPLMTRDGSEVLAGPQGWNSRSVYFWGPDDAVLELIARSDLGGGPGGLLDISEVAFAVPDVPRARETIVEGLGVAPFVPVTDVFSPVGDQHGLIILTGSDRVLLPTDAARGLVAPIEVRVRGPLAATVAPTPETTVVATAGGSPYLGPGAA